MQWYDPLNKFMLLKQCDWPALGYSGGAGGGGGAAGTGMTSVFEMLIAPELEYPLVCTSIRRNLSGSSSALKLDLINLNSSSSWLHSDELEMDGTATMVPRREPLPVVKVHQVSGQKKHFAGFLFADDRTGRLIIRCGCFDCSSRRILSWCAMVITYK